MAVLHDFMCKKHGVFESREAAPPCPMKGCDEDVFKVFLKPVAVKSAKTKIADAARESLALDFNATDFKPALEGEHQSGFHKRNNNASDVEFREAAAAMSQQQPQTAQAQRSPSGVLWGAGGRFNMQGALAGGFARPVKDESTGVGVAGALPRVRPSVAIRDPDNLKLPT